MIFSRKIFSKTWYILCCAIILALFSSCNDEDTDVRIKKYGTLADFKGSAIGTMTGTPYEEMASEYLPGAEWLYYDDMSSQILALQNGNIDAMIADSPIVELVAAQYPDEFAQFPDIMSSCDFSMMMKKGGKLTDPFSQGIRELKAEGIVDKMLNKWLSGKDSVMRIDWSKYDISRRKNGVIRFAFDPASYPMLYIGDDGKPSGLETELLLLVADKLDKGVEFINTTVASLILYIKQEKADVAASCLIITPERLENVDFCESYYAGGLSLLCRKAEVILPEIHSSRAVIASEVGTTSEAEAKKTFPHARYLTVPDANSGFLAVSSKKAKAFATDRETFESFRQTGGLGLKIYKDSTYGNSGKIAVGISPKTSFPDAENKVNAFIQEMQAKGILQEMKDRWLYEQNNVMPDIDAPEHPQYTLNIGTTGLSEPYTFYHGGELTGFDIELAKRFALWCNAELIISTYDWSTLVSSCAAAKVDFIFSKLHDTPERRESILFSKPYDVIETVMVVRDEEHLQVSESDFIQEIQESFKKTFVREGRWRMILKGLAVTLWITLGAGILGTLLGFLLCLALRSRKEWLSTPFRGFTSLMQGIPSLVILMITYFVIFGQVDISPIFVGIIAFGMMFAVSVAGILNTGIEAIDRGQWEAAAALGFGKSGTFAHVILPQAIRHILPLYKGEFISMMQLTSIAGYISIEELTKVGDIIRSRTYEAFFPLIAIAIIYFALSSMITYGIGRIEIVIDPLRRPRKLPKGIRKREIGGTERSKAEATKSKVAKSDMPDSGVLDSMETSSGKRGIQVVKYEESQASEGTENREALLIRIEHLKKVYPNVTPLKDVNADIHRGEVISIIGPSGTGKSTLMRCINRLEDPTEGKVSVFGMDTSDKKTDLKVLRRRAGMVFQSFNLFSHLTVLENIMLAPTLLNHETPLEAYDHAMKLLRQVGMAEKVLNYPAELSGGQKQRVAIARALAMNPEIIFFDEPTSALDPTMVGEVLAVIKSLARQGLTMMIVTHEMKFARDVSTRIFYMDQGIIYEDGTPAQIFDAPQKERTRQFIQKLKVLEINIISPSFDFIEINNRIFQYGLKNSMNRRYIFWVQNIFEELCVVMLAPRLGHDVYIRFLLEFSEESGQIKMNIRYNGPSFDPLSEGDKLSVRMIRGYCSEISHQSPAEDPAFGNEIRITLKK